jgi:hypothetical protein
MISFLSSVPGVEKAELGERQAEEALDEGLHFDLVSKPGSDPRAELSAAVVQKGWKLIELRTERYSLEDIFLRATAQEFEESGEGEEAGEGGVES